MATTIAPPHAGEIKFTVGRPETFALKFLEPKVFEGSFGPRALWTTCDEGYGERKIWMDYEDASNLVIELRRLKVRVGEPIRVTKVKHPRGGGVGYLVARAETAQDAAPPAWVTETTPEPPATPPTRLEAQMAQSIELVRSHGPRVFQSAPAPVDAPADSVLMAALKAAVDATLEATVYAARKGLELAFTTEDIRCCALTVYIQNSKGGR